MTYCKLHEQKVFKKAKKKLTIKVWNGKETVIDVCKPCYNKLVIRQFEINCKKEKENEK